MVFLIGCFVNHEQGNKKKLYEKTPFFHPWFGHVSRVALFYPTPFGHYPSSVDLIYHFYHRHCVDFTQSSPHYHRLHPCDDRSGLQWGNGSQRGVCGIFGEFYPPYRRSIFGLPCGAYLRIGQTTLTAHHPPFWSLDAGIRVQSYRNRYAHCPRIS